MAPAPLGEAQTDVNLPKLEKLSQRPCAEETIRNSSWKMGNFQLEWGNFQLEWENSVWNGSGRVPGRAGGDTKRSVALSMATAGLGGGLRDALWLC